MKGRLAVNEAATWSRNPLSRTSRSFSSSTPNEVRPLEILDPRMIGREAAGRTFQAVAVQRESLSELPVVACPPPTVGPLDDRLPDLAERLGFGPP